MRDDFFYTYAVGQQEAVLIVARLRRASGMYLRPELMFGWSYINMNRYELDNG